ncbi:phosphate ABC transporter substrate-binding protein PstS [Acidihalobacter yilgarnensis]|uniref:Phosphate-binding protein PstS n=1 Tax=Acidihalobacter yilgarnensis TaxID=2819280 RepID=A0A1D8IPL9_9GAMM|nr:phosphate ABC transporter substrate-binding protein PstS [Acidihalobacter yilgarnensis]AOU98389.1 phosphate ABC transporter substrate-binding protein PstS [Acidihalobacter yilgarnensis]
MLKYFSKGVVIGVALMSAGLAQAEVTQINGAGATFPYPVYSQWADAYHKATGVELNYQAIGSGGGIKQIKAKTVDFGASDAPLKADELEKHGLMQFPMIMGGVVPVVNIKGLHMGHLRLDGELLADIFMGKIKHWDDARIEAMNPGLKLPHRAITVVHRSDGSGTTFIFTNYLTKVSKSWADKIGNNKSVDWPAGVGGKGNQGVANYVNRINGSIGYVEYAYALQNKMNYVRLKNLDGEYVSPTAENFQAAAAGADWQHAPGFYMVLTDQPGAKSWPITGASFILVYKQADKPEVTKAVLKFFDWSYRHGQTMAEKLDYVPMPEKVVKMVEATWASDIKGADGAAVWTSSDAE